MLEGDKNQKEIFQMLDDGKGKENLNGPCLFKCGLFIPKLVSTSPSSRLKDTGKTSGMGISSLEVTNGLEGKAWEI